MNLINPTRPKGLHVFDARCLFEVFSVEGLMLPKVSVDPKVTVACKSGDQCKPRNVTSHTKQCGCGIESSSVLILNNFIRRVA